MIQNNIFDQLIISYTKHDSVNCSENFLLYLSLYRFIIAHMISGALVTDNFIYYRNATFSTGAHNADNKQLVVVTCNPT